VLALRGVLGSRRHGLIIAFWPTPCLRAGFIHRFPSQDFHKPQPIDLKSLAPARNPESLRTQAILESGTARKNHPWPHRADQRPDGSADEPINRATNEPQPPQRPTQHRPAHRRNQSLVQPQRAPHRPTPNRPTPSRSPLLTAPGTPQSRNPKKRKNDKSNPNPSWILLVPAIPALTQPWLRKRTPGGE
jgi:hypothetical protein